MREAVKLLQADPCTDNATESLLWEYLCSYNQMCCQKIAILMHSVCCALLYHSVQFHKIHKQSSVPLKCCSLLPGDW